MKQNNNYAKYIHKDNQDNFRGRMFEILKNNPVPLRQLAKDIDISLATLFRFLKEDKLVDFIRLTKIEKWIKNNEK